MRHVDADALMREFAEFVRASNNSDFADVPTWNDAVSLVGSAPTIETEPYIEFCEWVADTVLYEDFEDKWTLGAFAEVACRKLHKLGFVRKDGEYWTKNEVEE